MSEKRPDSSGDVNVEAATDPVVEIITSAGLIADRRVHECALLAAAAHRQRFENQRADERAVNGSTFLWALWRQDETVRTALEQTSVRLTDFETLLGITGNLRPLTDPIELGEDLARALRTFVDVPRKMQLTVTLPVLGVAILQDVVANGGFLGDRLRRLGTDAGAVLDALLLLMTDTPESEDETKGAPLVRVRDLTPRRFGVQLPSGSDDPGPYVARDVDVDLDQLLRERPPVVAVAAPPMSGATRAVYEALRRVRPDDQVLLLHEFLDAEGVSSKVSAEDLDRLRRRGVDVVWVRDLRVFLDSSPVFEDWFHRRGDILTATLVVLLRPEDLDRAAKLGLVSDAVVEVTGGLSGDEQARARDLYGRELTTVPAIAAAASRRHGVLRANYAADSAAAARLLDQDSDDLDIRADVDMLAKLIASKDVHPPLSIGLFGPWGSGKSFLMRQVQLRITDLADRSRRTSNGAASGYLGEVVPVEFNAWQYAHGSALWAALINRVFEEIEKRLGGDERYQQVLRDIAEKNVGVAQAHKRLDTARAKVEQSRPAANDRVIQDVVKDHDITDEATKKLTAGLNLDTATKQVSDLKNEYDRLVTTTSRLSKGWSTASLVRKIAVVGLVAIGLAAVVALASVPDLPAQVGVLLAGIGSIMAAIKQVLKPVNQGLEQAARVLRADEADKQELRHAQEDVDQASRQLAAAKSTGLAGLYGFVSDRSSAAEYREHLGMAPMIRDDLERLANMSRRAEGLPGIDRIVIFIDDLDRCPASDVVRVLEAVNLLFGFELFVVVVAVDSRWLLRSLKGTFSEAFDAVDGSAPTPQNYLEKIIQIPFWLQPMQETGFGRLVTSLAGEVDSAPGRRGSDAGNASAAGSETPWAGDQLFHTEEPGEGDVLDATAANTTSFPAGGGGEKTAEGSEGRRVDDLNPEALRLTQEERDFMLRFLPLVGTPRAVKRFLNTYQLLRVSVEDVGAFLDQQDYKPVLILLALVTGTASITDRMIEEMRSMTQADFATFLGDTQEEQHTDDQDRSRAWKPIASACAGLPTAMLTPEIIDAWLPKVARYSFHPVEV